MLGNLASVSTKTVDAWYLDGFTPARNSEMWSQELFTSITALSAPGATFASFTAAGDVRRMLSDSGFEVRKRSGWGLKRECIAGQLNAEHNASISFNKTPWDLPSTESNKVSPAPASPTTALVIGAGLAGATAAMALAQRGVHVTVLEQNTVASGGSANPQGILYTRLSLQHSALQDFSLQSFQFAANFYQQLFAQGKLKDGEDGALCGMFAQSSADEEMSRLQPLLQQLPSLAQVLDAAAASEKLGVEQFSAGYWYPRSGWLNPQAVCRSLLAHSNITVLESTGRVELDWISQQWHAKAGDKILAAAPVAILATANATTEFAPAEWLDLQAVRGQTTTIPSNSQLQTLRAALCHAGYIAPAQNNQHCIGATFDPQDSALDVRDVDNLANLEGLGAAVPKWAETLSQMDSEDIAGRVRLRCASHDYLPIVGPIPNYSGFLDQYAGLRKDAKKVIEQRGHYVPGLYVSTAHGSRGLTSTPLGAQLLASQICGEIPPLSRNLCRALNPARFIIRNLSRNRI